MSSATAANPDDCPVCGRDYERRVVSKLGGTIKQGEGRQDATCFWPTEASDGTAALAVTFHVNPSGDPRDGTIELGADD